MPNLNNNKKKFIEKTKFYLEIIHTVALKKEEAKNKRCQPEWEKVLQKNRESRIQKQKAENFTQSHIGLFLSIIIYNQNHFYF